MYRDTSSVYINKPIAIHELVTDKKYDLLAITETWMRTKGDDASIAEFTPNELCFYSFTSPYNFKNCTRRRCRPYV